MIFHDMAPFAGMTKPPSETTSMTHPNTVNTLRSGGHVNSINIQESTLKATSIKNFVIQVVEPDNDDNY